MMGEQEQVLQQVTTSTQSCMDLSHHQTLMEYFSKCNTLRRAEIQVQEDHKTIVTLMK